MVQINHQREYQLFKNCQADLDKYPQINKKILKKTTQRLKKKKFLNIQTFCSQICTNST